MKSSWDKNASHYKYGKRASGQWELWSSSTITNIVLHYEKNTFVSCLNLYPLWANSEDDKLTGFFLFSLKIGFDISCSCLLRRQFA